MITRILRRLFKPRPVKTVDLTHGTLARYADGSITFSDDGKYDMPPEFAFLRNDLPEVGDAWRKVKLP